MTLLTKTPGIDARPSLEAQWEHIERLMESNEGFFGELVDSVRNFFGDAAEYLASAFASQDATDTIRFSYDRRLSYNVGDADAALLKGTMVMRPPGTSVPLDEWVDMLAQTQSVVDTLEKNVYGPTLKMLAMMISDPETLNVKNPRIAMYRIQVPDLTKVKKTMAACRNEKNDMTKTLFFEAYRSTDSFGEVEKGFESVVKDYAKTTRKSVKEASERIAEIVEKIVYKINDPEDATVMSDPMSVALSKVIHDVAQCVELYAAHSYNMTMTSLSLEENQKTLKKAI